ELRFAGVAAQEREEAVDVEVVERGLDLIEHVERAGTRKEDREQERQRGQRLLAAREQRQPLHGLACRRHLDLDAELLVFLLRALGAGVVHRAVAVVARRRAAEHGPRTAVLANQPQTPAAAGEELADDVL